MRVRKPKPIVHTANPLRRVGLYAVAGFIQSERPQQWQRLPATQPFFVAHINLIVHFIAPRVKDKPMPPRGEQCVERLLLRVEANAATSRQNGSAFWRLPIPQLMPQWQVV